MDTYKTVNYVELTDNELILLINCGENEPLQVLIKRYLPVLKFYAEKFFCTDCDRDDLIQEGTMALYSAVKAFKPGQASFSTFASACIRRAMADVIKAANRKRRIPGALVSSLEDVELTDENSPENILIEKENYRCLADTIKLELSAFEYKVLLFFLSDYSYSAIATELDVSIKAVDNSLKRIRKKLKK